MAVRLHHLNRSSDTGGPGPPPEVGPYQLFVLLLCVIVLVMLAVEAAIPLAPDTRQILHRLDLAICFFFFLDFLQSFRTAPNRLRYMLTWGWIDLLSSIPYIFLARWGRAARLARLLRILRGIRSVKEILSFVLGFRRAETALLTLILVAMLTIAFSSIGILHLERVPHANIKTATDALWWTFVTITTVGYGDYSPVTPEGRLLGGALMTVGIGLFGTFTAYVASWFVEPLEAEQEREMELMRKELGEIRRLLASRARAREVEGMDVRLDERQIALTEDGTSAETA